jgi:ParB-like chromosome segregation protein Spo0J
MPDWPADTVERHPVASLVPYARNARTHSAEQVAQIAASIREWGWTTPVLVDDAGGIIAGHGRILAAQSLGLADVPVMVAHGWTEAQKRAYVLADNKLGLNAGWDEPLLRDELASLRDVGVDLGMIGFSADELTALFADPASIADGFADDDAGEVDEADTMLVLGPYRMAVDRVDFLAWQEAIRGAVGFAKQDIIAEILRRVGLAAR